MFGIAISVAATGCPGEEYAPDDDDADVVEEEATELLLHNPGFELSLETSSPWIGWGNMGMIFEPPAFHVQEAMEGSRVFGAVVDGDRMDGGIYQIASGAIEGQTYRANAQVYQHTTQDGEAASRIGVDPTGGIDPFYWEIVWSEWVMPEGMWFAVFVEFEAEAEEATVFLEFEQGGASQAGFTCNYFDEIYVEPI